VPAFLVLFVEQVRQIVIFTYPVMKKPLLTILAFLYILSTTGASLQLHFCMGKLADWSIGHTQSNTCSECGMEKTDEQANGCCNDEQAFIKNTADQKPGHPVQTPVTFFQRTASLALAYPDDIVLSTVSAKPWGDAEHRRSNTPIYLLISSFRI
jgi:hypothetical protein